MKTIKRALNTIVLACLLPLAFTVNAAGQTIRFTGVIVHHPCPLAFDTNGELNQELNSSCLSYNKITTRKLANSATNLQTLDIPDSKIIKNVFYY